MAIDGEPELNPRSTKRIAWLVNGALLIAGPIEGYRKTWQSQPDANMGIYAWALITTSMALFAILGVCYSIFRLNTTRLIKPSFDRVGLQVWRDPLQFLMSATLLLLAAALGQMLRLPRATPTDIFYLKLNLCLAGGLAAGQVISYLAFRKRLVAP